MNKKIFFLSALIIIISFIINLFVNSKEYLEIFSQGRILFIFLTTIVVYLNLKISKVVFSNLDKIKISLIYFLFQLLVWCISFDILNQKINFNFNNLRFLGFFYVLIISFIESIFVFISLNIGEKLIMFSMDIKDKKGVK